MSSLPGNQLVWLITGCSSGLGVDIVKEALKRGDKVIATARNAERIRPLEEEGGDKLKILELDVSKPPEQIREVIHDALGIWGQIDVVVNNAGLGDVGPVESTSDKAFRDLIEANFFGPLNVTKAILPHFRERHSGTIVFIGSRSSHIPMPFLGLYGGSKASIAQLSESLAQEVAPLGVRVFCMDPSAMNTPQYTKVPEEHYKTPSIKDYQPMADKFMELALKSWTSPKGDTAKVARVVADFVRKEGCAAGDRQLPVRLPLGSEVRLQLEARLEKTRKLLEEWKETIDSIDG